MESDQLQKKARKLRTYFINMTRRIQMVHRGCCQNECDLTSQELKAVEFLGQFGPSMMKNLADYLNLAVSSTTTLVDKLETKGLISRNRSEDDRRVVKVSLTAEGVRNFNQAAEAYLNFCLGALSTLSEEDQDSLLELFRKMSHSPLET